MTWQTSSRYFALALLPASALVGLIVLLVLAADSESNGPTGLYPRPPTPTSDERATREAQPTLTAEQRSASQAIAAKTAVVLRRLLLQEHVASRTSVKDYRRLAYAVSPRPTEPFDIALRSARSTVVGEVGNQFIDSVPSERFSQDVAYVVSRLRLDDGSTINIAQPVGLDVGVDGQPVLGYSGTCSHPLDAEKTYALLLTDSPIPDTLLVVEGHWYEVKGGVLTSPCERMDSSPAVGMTPEEFTDLVEAAAN